MAISESKRVQVLVEVLALHKIKHIVFSPGSRNAPLVISLAEDNRFDCLTVVDERSAGFYALGMAQQLREPVVLCCTSGSASLNYSSAISEAYYQKIPLLVLTTDRPPEWIHHGEGQSINQQGIFQNIAQSNYNLPIGESEDDVWMTQRSVNQGINDAVVYQKPVHVNIPFREPLYNTVSQSSVKVQKIEIVQPSKKITEEQVVHYRQKLKRTDKILVLCGLNPKNDKLNYVLGEFVQNTNVVVLTETTSNLSHRKFIPCIDRVLSTIEDDKEFQPNILITIGGAIISKKIKQFLRKNDSLEHYHIENTLQITDTFKHLAGHIAVEPEVFFRQIIEGEVLNTTSTYQNKWHQHYQISQTNHENYLRTAEWSDLKAFDVLYNTFPESCNLQMGNSSVVRYIQLFNQIPSITYNSNRGVSGIDGCTSTASGASLVNQKLTVLITGDLSFVYDINALWNNYLSSNLRIIVINNDGGGIFSIIPGPTSTKAHREFFEVGNQADIQSLVKSFDVNYYQAFNEQELEEQLAEFYNPQANNRPAVLEIKTPKDKNADVLKDYFKHLND